MNQIPPENQADGDPVASPGTDGVASLPVVDAEAQQTAADSSQPVVAELVGESRFGEVVPQPPTGKGKLLVRTVDPSAEFQNMAAVGGAVGATVLGAWSIVCALISPFAAVNALLGLALGLYGLASIRRRLAVVGIGLAVIGLVLSLMNINDVLSGFFFSGTGEGI